MVYAHAHTYLLGLLAGHHCQLLQRKKVSLPTATNCHAASSTIIKKTHSFLSPSSQQSLESMNNIWVATWQAQLQVFYFSFSLQQLLVLLQLIQWKSNGPLDIPEYFSGEVVFESYQKHTRCDRHDKILRWCNSESADHAKLAL